MKDKPIINSLLDTDIYKLRMLQLIWRRHADVPVMFGFINRSSDIRIPDLVSIEEIREQAEHVRTLRFADAELAFLESLDEFDPAFLEFLRTLRMPEINIWVENGRLRAESETAWSQSSLWEIYFLAIVSELFSRRFVESEGVSMAEVEQEAERRLDGKLNIWSRHLNLRWVDFGTRRRLSQGWHREALMHAMEKNSRQFAGTSNVLLAKELGLLLRGTMAHELFMVYAGIYSNTDEELLASHNRVLRDWWSEYGEKFSIALTDTFGADFFFRDFAPEQARLWRGLRQDSGNPFLFGKRTIKFYRDQGIDPRSKHVIFSDGLNALTMVSLHVHFLNRLGHGFGIGTNFTKDALVPAPSIVMKALRANGIGLAKLTEDPEKATGDKQMIERLKRLFL